MKTRIFTLLVAFLTMVGNAVWGQTTFNGLTFTPSSAVVSTDTEESTVEINGDVTISGTWTGKEGLKIETNNDCEITLAGVTIEIDDWQPSSTTENISALRLSPAVGAPNITLVLADNTENKIVQTGRKQITPSISPVLTNSKYSGLFIPTSLVGKCVIKGNGNLYVKGDDYAIFSITADLTIENGNVRLDSNVSGIYIGTGTFLISGGSLSIGEEQAPFYGIAGNQTSALIISGGEINIKTAKCTYEDLMGSYTDYDEIAMVFNAIFGTNGEYWGCDYRGIGNNSNAEETIISGGSLNVTSVVKNVSPSTDQQIAYNPAQSFSTGDGTPFVVLKVKGALKDDVKGIFFYEKETEGEFRGDHVTLNANATIPENKTLEIETGKILTVDGMALTVPESVTLTNNGQVFSKNNGTVTDFYTITKEEKGCTLSIVKANGEAWIEGDDEQGTELIKAGETITVTVNNAEAEGTVVVTQANGKPVEVSKDEETNVYTFTMPEANVIINADFAKEEEQEPEQPGGEGDDNPGGIVPDAPKYYNIYEDEICEGIEVEFSRDVVKEGQSVLVKITVDEEFDASDLALKFKRSLFGYWEDLTLTPTENPGEYIIENIYTDIYVRAEGAVPTGIESIDGTKVYTKDGSIYVQTPTQEQVQIISISGAVLKNEQQVGLKQYTGLQRGIYIICIDEARFKVRL